jgi:surface protein
MNPNQSSFSFLDRNDFFLRCRDRSCPDGRRVFDTTDDLRNAVAAYRLSPFGPPPNCWDVSRLTDFFELFFGVPFNEPIGDWDTSKVTDMSFMFYGASSFNQDISGWDTSAVTDMEKMFFGANSFNQDISGWDTAKVTDMTEMLLGAEDFHQNLCRWKDIAVGADKTNMFFGTSCPHPGTPTGNHFCVTCD